MIIRKYQSTDIKELEKLFYSTVHTINAKDTKEQLDAWTDINLEEWNKSFEQHFSLVAVIDNRIVGFGDIDDTGYLDHLYVSKDYQRQGIATALCDMLEKHISNNIVTHSSITAKPFFEHRGYKVIKRQQVEKNGVFLTNFVMEKCKF